MLPIVTRSREEVFENTRFHRGLGGCRGGITQSTPLLPFSRWLQVFILTWVVHVYSCPGLAFFCLPIDTAPTWHLLPHPVVFRFGFVLLSRRSALGLLAGTRLVVWEGFSRLSSERPFGHAHARPPVAYGSLGSCLPAILAYCLQRFGSLRLFSGRVFPSPLSWLRAGLSIFSGPLGACQGPRIFTPRLHFFGFVGVGVRRTGGIGSIPGVVWGACSHCNCVFLLPLWVLFSREGFLCGGGCARWLSGCGSDYFFGMCGVAVSRHDKCSVGLVS